MLKTIETKQLRVGMYLHELSASWLTNPFWRTSRKLDSAEDIQQILDAGIKQAIIDISKGLDVKNTIADDGAVDGALPIPVAAAPLNALLAGNSQRTSIENEREIAARICERSYAAVTSMFTEARMGRAVNAEVAAKLVTEMSESIGRNAHALISLVRLKSQDNYTYMHSVAVGALMISLARQLGLDESQVQEAGNAGLLHDIGKMAIPTSILNKQGSLSEQEFQAVKHHPTAGYRMLQASGQLSANVLDVCLHHHEKMDGSGYPDGLSGTQISLFARMGAVCDVYDAITSERPYKQAWCPALAMKKMASWVKGHFDPQVFQAFVKAVGIYPVGSLVRLASGRLAIVLDQTDKSLLTPQVRVFFSTKSNAYIKPESIDLSAPGQHDKIVSIEEEANWGLKDTARFCY
jgi:putative nucleotidyltransferase with HDIG domain